MGCSPPGFSVHGNLQARILEWGAISSSGGIFPTQGSNPGLLRCRQIPSHLSHLGSPYWDSTRTERTTCCWSKLHTEGTRSSVREPRGWPQGSGGSSAWARVHWCVVGESRTRTWNSERLSGHRSRNASPGAALPALSPGRGLGALRTFELRAGWWHFKPQPLTGSIRSASGAAPSGTRWLTTSAWAGRRPWLWHLLSSEARNHRTLTSPPAAACLQNPSEVPPFPCSQPLLAPISLRVKGKDPSWTAKRSSTTFLFHPPGAHLPPCPFHSAQSALAGVICKDQASPPQGLWPCGFFCWEFPSFKYF